jgi:hypothetical protein
MRFGADGLLGEEGLHRIAAPARMPGEVESSISMFAQDPIHLPPPAPQSTPIDPHLEEEAGMSEPVLTADELRALLQEQPSMPPSGGNEN